MDLTKYVVETPRGRDLQQYLDAEFRKIQRALDSIASWKDSEVQFETGVWTPVVRGGTVAGTYEISSFNCRYARFFNRVFVDMDVRLQAVITGGGTGNLQISGLPFAAAGVAWGACRFDGVNWTDSHAFVNALVTGSSVFFDEIIDNSSSSNVQISGVSGSDLLFATLHYDTND